ncbi:class I SAM-dependent methyltransferase [Eudoraea chungangensis]|uniref:class I SAM-dependent methyltransferase n=1 Tax=Eudoraea chungangensis TaxID=1481905 RepID=UPI0023EB5777|nr:class I SAM-dependent methyltransferase [Eudoraea chungangensis]
MDIKNETEIYVCQICGNENGNMEYAAREMMYGLRHQFKYFQCNACDCLQIGEIPENMSPYYPSGYYSFTKFEEKKFKGFIGSIRKWKYASLVSKNILLQKFTRIITGKADYDIFKGLDVNIDTKILDVGSGNGSSFLYPLAEAGFKNLLGCDPYLSKSISYKNGLEITNSEIYEISGKWNVITFHHSFEHIGDPIKTLLKVSELLSPNGVAILRIPTTSSFAWKKYRTNWVQLDAPRHFFIHSIRSMQKLADLAKLDFYKVEYDSTAFQFLGSEKYIKDESLFSVYPKGFKKGIITYFEKLKYKKMARKLNKEKNGDQAAFYFRLVG